MMLVVRTIGKGLRETKGTHCVQRILRDLPLGITPWTVARQAPLVHGIFHARILKHIAISYSSASSQPGDQNHISSIDRRILYHLSRLGSGQKREYKSVYFVPHHVLLNNEMQVEDVNA